MANYEYFYSMKKAATFPILVVESNDYITDVMSRTAEGSFPEAVLHFVADDQIAQRNLDAKAAVLPKLILHGTYLDQTQPDIHTIRWLREHPVAGTIAHILLGYSALPVSVGHGFEGSMSTYYPKPEMIIEWATLWGQLRNDWFTRTVDTASV